MKVLSVRQPWAWLIVRGFKEIENRRWPSCKYRGELYIHAGKRIDIDALVNMGSMLAKLNKGGREDYLSEAKVGVSVAGAKKNLLLGGIVGRVVLVDCVTESDSIWFDGSEIGLLFDEPETVPFIPLKGQLGIFNWEGPK